MVYHVDVIDPSPRARTIARRSRQGCQGERLSTQKTSCLNERLPPAGVRTRPTLPARHRRAAAARGARGVRASTATAAPTATRSPAAPALPRRRSTAGTPTRRPSSSPCTDAGKKTSSHAQRADRASGPARAGWWTPWSSTISSTSCFGAACAGCRCRTTWCAERARTVDCVRSTTSCAGAGATRAEHSSRRRWR